MSCWSGRVGELTRGLSEDRALCLPENSQLSSYLTSPNRFGPRWPPTFLDVPLNMRADAVDLPDPSTPMRPRGVGEVAFGAGVAAVVCAPHDAAGTEAFKRTPMMTDVLLNLVEGRPQAFRELTAHV